MTLLTGLTEAGVEVPVQVLPDGRLVAEGLRGAPGPAGSQGPPGPIGPQGPASDAVGFRNVLINGDLRINQRDLTHAAVAVGKYFADRWKKTSATEMTQIVEDGNFQPSATYTLSGTGIATQQLTSPASGDWTLPNIPATARKIQLELGTVATTFERRPIGMELELCQRYYRGPVQFTAMGAGSGAVRYANSAQPRMYAGHMTFGQTMRAAPTLTLNTSVISYVNCSDLTAGTIYPDGTFFYVATNSAGPYHTTNWSASFDAEL